MQIPISRESICLGGGGLVLLPMPPSPPQRANKQEGHSGEVEEGAVLERHQQRRGDPQGDRQSCESLPETLA